MVLVKREVELALLTNDIHLKFVPITNSRKMNKKGKIRGNYKALITIKDEHGEPIKHNIYHVSNDWVEDNFTKESLSVVQRIALQTQEVHFDKVLDKNEHGYLSLDKEGKKYVLTNTDLRQISKVRYLPLKEVRNLSEKKFLTGRWQGIIHTRNKGEKVEFVDLDEEWVNKNFTKEMRQLVMDLRIEERNGYVSILEGANELKDAVSEEKRLGFLQVKYCNDGMDLPLSIRQCSIRTALSRYAPSR
jgi:hypothetical protein